jgi:hypothetical protein
VEVQDTKAKLMYPGALNVSGLDAHLEPYGFVRQYCECENRDMRLRQLNCMYTQRGQRTFWVTGSRRPPMVIDPSSHLYVGGTLVPESAPRWGAQGNRRRYAIHLKSTSRPGALDHLLLNDSYY